MITLQTDYTIQRYAGLSTDTKPAASNGDLYLEMDSGKVYAYDQSGSQWLEVSLPW